MPRHMRAALKRVARAVAHTLLEPWSCALEWWHLERVVQLGPAEVRHSRSNQTNQPTNSLLRPLQPPTRLQ